MAIAPNSPAARDIAYQLHPYTNLEAHQKTGSLIIREGKGIYVYDDTGKQYIEGLAGLWSMSLGWDQERLVTAATNAMRKLPFYHQFGAKAHEPGIDLAEKLIEMAPVKMSKAFFANSGSEANDTAIKMIWYYNAVRGKPERKKIIARLRGYHGVTLAAASLTGLPHLHKYFGLPIAEVKHTSCPYYYRNAQPGETEEEFSTRMAADLEKMILDEGPDTVAAFFAEPIMGAGGVILPPKTYFEKIQAVLKKYDILFVVDEVICGFYRTGNAWGSQTYGLKPDILTCAKALSSSYLPISGVMITEQIFNVLAKGSAEVGNWGHGYTYSGHPVAAAVALETLKMYEDLDIGNHVKRLAPVLQNGIRKFADHPLVGDVRGIGLIGAIELVKNKKTKEAFDPKSFVGVYLTNRAQEHGLIVRAMGDHIGFCPPLIIKSDEIEELLKRFGKALDETYVMAKDKGLV
ncbi:MAG: aspartate aminotransferase family protein [Alphaproteobacteria bacterium]|nr:aspartate aminotransferase family protein [Alphaproteobacteria bacterium]